MGVSFQVAKSGTRYKPKLLPVEAKDDENDSDSDSEVVTTGKGAKVADPSSVLVKSPRHSVLDDIEASFSLNLFGNGFSIGRASELFNDVPEKLHPYDRESETLFSAIECGWLPGEIFDDLPCQYVNGAILCEIQDYRGCLIQGRVTDSSKILPVVNKVLLHMRMENIVKDILSVYDDSWTYRDILEVESRILKALQPDLHLHPQPLQERCSGESLRKKVDLGIMWSWKKRKLISTSETVLHSSNSDHVTDIPINCVTQNSSSVLGLSCQERGVTFSEHNASTSAVNKELQSSQSNLLTSQPKYNVGDSCNMSALTVMPTSVSVPKRSLDNSDNALSKHSSSVLGERVRSETQAVKGPLLKKPKLEQVDLSSEQLTGSQTENILLPYQQQNKLLHKGTEDGKFVHEIFQDKVHPSVLGKRVGCETQAVKRPLLKKPKLKQVDLYFEQLTGSQTENTVLPFLQQNKLLHQRTEDGKVLHERFQDKVHPSLAINNCQTTSFQGISEQQAGPATSLVISDPAKASFSNSNVRMMKDNHSVMDSRPFQSNLLQLQKQDSSPLFKDNIATETSRKHMAQTQIKNRSAPQMRKDMEKCQVMAAERHEPTSSQNINSLPRDISISAKWEKSSLIKSQPPETKVDSFLEKFLKIQAVTKRYRLNKRKYKSDKRLLGKPTFPLTPFAVQLLSSNHHTGMLNTTSTNRISVSECSMDWGIIQIKRILSFVRQPRIHREDPIRLVISEKLNEGIEANVFHGIEEMFSINYPLPPAFPTTHSANLLADQFTSLMVREGYYLASEQVRPQPRNSDGGLSSQWCNLTSIATPPARANELTSAILAPGLSPFRLSPMSSSRSANNSMQLLSQNTFSGGQSLPIGTTQSAIPIPSSWISKQHLETAAQVNCMKLEWQQQILNKRTHLHYQMLQRQLQQFEINQRRSIVGGFSVTKGRLGMIQQAGAVQWHGNNDGLCLFANPVEMKSSTPPMALGGQVPLAGSVGRSNNVCSQIPGVVLDSNDLAAVLSKLRTVPVQGNAGVTPIDMMQQPQQHMVHQQQQDMISLLQHSEAASSLAQPLVGSPHSQVVTHQQFDQPPQASQQLIPESVPQQINAMVGYGSQELSSQTHASVGGNKM